MISFIRFRHKLEHMHSPLETTMSDMTDSCQLYNKIDRFVPPALKSIATDSY